MRTDLIFRVFDLRVPAILAVILAGQPGLMGQTPQGAQQPQQTTTEPQTSQQKSDADVLAQQAQASARPKETAPDYPDRRTITFDAFYWVTGFGSGPNIIGGSTSVANGVLYANLSGIGKPKESESLQVSLPITRTGELKVEYFRTQGDGNQTLTSSPTIFLNPFYAGDYLATTYKMQSGKLYLDDLLWPYKFPVPRLRLKSLWEFQYFTVVTSVNAPLAPTTDALGNAISTTGAGTRTIYLPTLGGAAEYALTPHLLLRGEASGFGLPHKADIWDAAGTVSWRHNLIEVVAGVKVFHFKTSPNNTEYLTDTLTGPFLGIRFHIF